MKTSIEATAISRRYGSTWALRECSLRLPRGRVVAMVGPNGAGKTTFLRVAMGLDQQTAGRIQVLGLTPHDSGLSTVASRSVTYSILGDS